MILSPQMLWKEFDRHIMPLDTFVLSSVSSVDFCVRTLYFNGGANAASNARIFARFLEPITQGDSLNGAQEKKCIVIMPNYNQDINDITINAVAGGSTSVLIIDWAGDYNGRSRHTIYPKSMSYANFNPLTYINSVPNSPQNSCWFAWACTLLRSITFLQDSGYKKIGVMGLGVGSDSVWKAASYDNSITSAVCLLDSGLETFRASGGNEQLNYLACIQTINYAPLINCPLFMLAETNAKSGSFDKLIEQFNAINRADKLIYILPRADSLLNESIIKDLGIWFNYYLSGKGSLPSNNSIKTKKSENSLYFQATTQSESKAIDAYIYSTQSSDAVFRFWRCSKLSSVSESEFIGKVSIFDSKQKLLAYSNITFSNGFCCSTPLITLECSQLINIPLMTASPRRLIFDSEMGTGEFISIGSTVSLKIETGYNNISGISLDGGCILTYKIGDFLYSAHGAGSLQLIICSYISQTIVLKLTDSLTKSEYYVKKLITPENEWLKITLNAREFKNQSGTLANFDNAALIEIIANNKIIINNILWI